MMKAFPSGKLLIVLFSILLSTAAVADEPETYGEIFARKVVNGFTNMVLAPLEIPKNIINTTNQGNIFYGLTGGLAKGIVNTAGRMGAGLTDFVTSPLPTRQFVHPAYPWQDYFEKDTSYGKVFDVEKTGQQ